VKTLVARAGLRHFVRHPWQLVLALVGVAAGVAMAVGIDVALGSVRRSFALASEAVAGTATHTLTGGPAGLDDVFYRRLRTDPERPPGLRLSPLVTGYVRPQVTRRGAENTLLQVVGVDPWSGAPGSQLGISDASPNPLAVTTALVLSPGAAVVTEATAARWGLSAGAKVPIKAAGRVGELVIVQVVPIRDARQRAATEGLVLVDIATAQEVLGMIGHLSRVDVTVSGPKTEAASAVAWLRGHLPPGTKLETTAAGQGALSQMTRAFELNLRALSLLALLVGGFLVFNTMNFSVVQRRPLLAVLRTLGVTRRELGRNLLVEAAALGAGGSLLGVLGGVWLSGVLVRLVARAVSDLYAVVAVRDVPLAGGPLARGFLLGLAAALVSAWPAARDATRTEPTLVLHRSAQEVTARRRAPRWAWAGLGAIALAVALLALSGRSLALGLGALLVGLFGAALLTPLFVLLGAGVAARVLGRWRGATGRLAAGSIAAGLSRTGVASAALALALSVTTGIGLMVGSFRHAVADWLAQTLSADVYVSVPSAVSARADTPLPAAVVAALTRLPSVRGVVSTRVASVPVAGAGNAESTLVIVTDASPPRPPAAALLTGDTASIWRRYLRGEGVLVSEALAWKRRFAPGDTLSVQGDRDRVTWPVLAVYRDYGTDAGTIMLPRPLYARAFADTAITGLGLLAAPGVTDAQLVEAARAALGAADDVLVRSQRSLREASLAIFDRTFAITGVLRTFAIVVASFGVASALMAVALERSRALATLRALGATPGQVAELTCLETGVLGLFSGILSLPGGCALAVALIFVINRRSFGWTMSPSWDVPALLLAPALGLVAGLAGGLYPAWRAAHVSPAEALRDE